MPNGPRVAVTLLTWLAGSLALLAAVPAPAADKIPVDLELILAVDISGSIDAEEAKLQREGYAAALVDPLVVKAIRGGIHGKVAIAYFDWSDSWVQNQISDWVLVQDQASAEALARRLLAEPTRTARRTSITGAIIHAMPRFGSGPYQGMRRVLDISGDGPNNDGGPVDLARDRALAAGIVINGLPINNKRPSPFGFPALEDLDAYYEGCVIGGPGAFVVVAEDFRSFGEAVRRKLILEIASAPMVPPDWQRAGPPVLLQRVQRGQPPAGGAGRYPKGCDIGERQSQEFWRRRWDQ